MSSTLLWSAYFFADTAFLPRGTVEQGSGPIFFSGLLCTGQESDLQDCSLYSNQPPSTFSSCQHSQDVAVRCTGKKLMVVHLIVLPNTVPSSQTLMSVLRIMEDATRTVPTLSGATSAVVRVAIYSTRMGEGVTVSIYIH